MAQLESQLGALANQERELNERIETLKGVPLPAAEYFGKLVETGERKSRFRDYSLFLAGIAVTVLVEVLLKKLRWL